LQFINIQKFIYFRLNIFQHFSKCIGKTRIGGIENTRKLIENFWLKVVEINQALRPILPRIFLRFSPISQRLLGGNGSAIPSPLLSLCLRFFFYVANHFVFMRLFFDSNQQAVSPSILLGIPRCQSAI